MIIWRLCKRPATSRLGFATNKEHAIKPREKIVKINEAIDAVILNLSNGVEIKEYEIDNVRIVKRSPLELIDELRRIKSLLIKDMRASKTSVKYVFSGKY
nr:MAG TPA: hypothetical protein [Caudoviricetes sp.]